MFATLAGLAAALAACFVLLNRPAGPSATDTETITYEQIAFADLIPHTDPYIYYGDQEQEETDPVEEEMLDYLLQYQNY